MKSATGEFGKDCFIVTCAEDISKHLPSGLNDQWILQDIVWGGFRGRLWPSGMPSGSEAEGQQFKPDLGTVSPYSDCTTIGKKTSGCVGL